MSVAVRTDAVQIAFNFASLEVNDPSAPVACPGRRKPSDAPQTAVVANR
jgi:hypothetical protein